MAALRLILNLTLVASLAVICPARCQAETVPTTIGAVEVKTGGCPCCPDEAPETPDAPFPDDRCDGNCVCDGAVDGPKVAAVELPPAVPGDVPLAAAGLGRLATCSVESPDERPDAPDGATLRLLISSLVI